MQLWSLEVTAQPCELNRTEVITAVLSSITRSMSTSVWIGYRRNMTESIRISEYLAGFKGRPFYQVYTTRNSSHISSTQTMLVQFFFEIFFYFLSFITFL